MSQEYDYSNGVHVLKFFAQWCGPCKLYGPAFERVASMNDEAAFYAVDTDERPTMKEEFGVMSIPTTVILKDGEEVARINGVTSTRKLDDVVKSVLP